MDKHASPLADHSYPSRPDLTSAVAVIVPAPHFMYPKGGYFDVAGVWREEPDDTAIRFRPYLDEFVSFAQESMPPALGDAMGRVEPERYVFGPPYRAGMYEPVFFVLNVIPEVTDVAEKVIAWTTIGKWALSLKARWKDLLLRLRSQGQHPLERDQLVFSSSMVEAVCLLHALDVHAVRLPLDLQTYGRHFDAGSLDLPSGGEVYSIAISGDSASYLYRVNGRITPLDHCVVAVDGVTPLDLPDFSDYVSDPPIGTGEFSVRPRRRIVGVQ